MYQGLHVWWRRRILYWML